MLMEKRLIDKRVATIKETIKSILDTLYAEDDSEKKGFYYELIFMLFSSFDEYETEIFFAKEGEKRKSCEKFFKALCSDFCANEKCVSK